MSELTSGEKAFIGLLFTPISISHQMRTFIGGTFAYVQWDGPVGYDVYNMSLDLSKIASVNFSSNGDISGLSMSWVDANGNGINGISTDRYGIDNVPPSGAKGILIETGSIIQVSVRITSFTTADGKVHTADNLNY